MIRIFKTVLLLFLGLVGLGKLSAQDSPLFSFDKGVGIVAPDSSMSLYFQFNMQNRIELKTLSTNDLEISEFSAKVRRFRLKFSGFILDPRLTYKLQLAMEPNRVTSTGLNLAPRSVFDAMIYYKLSKRFTLGIGQTPIPGNRQRVNSSTSFQLVERSLVNSVFNIDLDFGLHGEYRFNPQAIRPLIFHGALTTGEGDNWVVAEEAGFSYTGRLDWYPLGAFLKKSAYKEGDLEWHLEPRLMAGLSYNFNDRAQRAGGQRGGLLYAERDISTVFADVIYKHQGWAFQGAYTTRTSDDPVTFDPGGSNIRYVYNGQGFNVQVSKYFRSKWEVVGRLTSVTPDEEIRDLTNERREWTLGLNRYIKSRAVKLQADASLHQSRAVDSDFVGQFGFRFQAQMGF